MYHENESCRTQSTKSHRNTDDFEVQTKDDMIYGVFGGEEDDESDEEAGARSSLH